MNRLLSVFVDVILPIIILIVAIVVAFIVYYFTKKKFDKMNDFVGNSTNAKPLVKLRETYCTEYEMIFLEAIHKALPRDCISFPHVGVSKLVEPKGNLLDYKAIQDKYVDICVFLRRDMKPILVIDLYQSSPVAQQLKKFDENVTKVLKEVKIPVLHKEIQNSYNIEELKVELLKNLNNDIVAYLKEKIITDSNK